jgi:hypothetical protein
MKLSLYAEEAGEEVGVLVSQNVIPFRVLEANALECHTGRETRETREESAEGGDMPLTSTTLGHVLSHIYDFDPGAAIYLPDAKQYEAATPCVVATPSTYTKMEEAALHEDCLNRGLTNWLNVAVVSDTCDGAVAQSEAGLVAAFNEDCREGGWLWKMMNYRKE